MSLLSAFGLGVFVASAVIVVLGDCRMLIGCIVGLGAIISDILSYLDEQK